MINQGTLLVFSSCASDLALWSESGLTCFEACLAIRAWQQACLIKERPGQRPMSACCRSCSVRQFETHHDRCCCDRVKTNWQALDERLIWRKPSKSTAA